MNGFLKVRKLKRQLKIGGRKLESQFFRLANEGRDDCKHHLTKRPNRSQHVAVAVRRDPELIRYYKKYSGKLIPNKIIVKVARKLLIRMYYCLKNKQNYIINYNNPESDRKTKSAAPTE